MYEIQVIFGRVFSPGLRPSARQRFYFLYTKKSSLWISLRCRLIASWGGSTSQGSGCSPVKAVRELGSERRRDLYRYMNETFPGTFKLIFDGKMDEILSQSKNHTMTLR